MGSGVQETDAKGRITFLDNLRTCTIFMVVLFHSGLVYESSGISAFFWIVDDPSTNDVSGILNLIVDTFLMPTMFFIAGYFALVPMRTKTAWEYLKSRFTRLMVPWIVAVFTLIPLYKIVFLYSRGLPQEHWTTYFHFTNGIYSQNWLWFLPVLFLFNVLFVFVSKIKLDLSRLTLGRALWGALFVGLGYGFYFDILGLQGWTKTPVLDFQNERLLIYFLAFLVGALCRKLGTFDKPLGSKKLYIFVCSTSWIPMNAYLFLIIVSFLYPGYYFLSEYVDALILRTSYLLTLLSMVYLLVVTFRRYLKSQGRTGAALSSSSYGVYIIHVVVMGALALALLDAPVPSLLKHLVLALSTFLVSSLLVWSYKKATAPKASRLPIHPSV
jgi:surface polysaccharide O-acyltransferase-like enzyme